MKSVPIPGDILRTSVFLGLTFDELVALGSVPLVLMLPGVMIREIPLIGVIAVGVVAALVVVAIAIQTPDGQTPLEWGPAMIRRRVAPNRYYIKPRRRKRADAPVLSRVITAERIVAESEVRADESVDGETTPEPLIDDDVSIGVRVLDENDSDNVFDQDGGRTERGAELEADSEESSTAATPAAIPKQ